MSCIYDLEVDPLEKRNLLWGDRLTQHSGAPEAVSVLWERLRAWQARTADQLDLPRPEPWGR
jgi:hypothetical protein